MMQQQQLQTGAQQQDQGRAMRKRESKTIVKLSQQLESRDVSPRLVPQAQINSLMSGSTPGGVIMGSNKRTLTNESNALLETTNKAEIQNYGKEIYELSLKEVKRRFSDNAFKENNEHNEHDKKPAESIAIAAVRKNQSGDTASNFIKSPKQVLGSSSQNLKNNPALGGAAVRVDEFNPNLTRERGSSAFKKYDPVHKESADTNRNQGE
jgi:hypothetical protein